MPDQPRERTAQFAELLQINQSRLYSYLHSIVRDLNDTDDLFQQVTLILWRKFEEFDCQRSFLAWACGIARLEARNFLRVRGRSKIYFSDDLNLLLIDAQASVTQDESEARRVALGRCVEKLRQRDRDLIEQCFAESRPVETIAQENGRSPQSVYNSLRRIRRSLYECARRSMSQGMAQEVPQ